MPTAFVLVNNEIGAEADVLKDLKKIEEVNGACPVYGVYDIIYRVKAETMDKLKKAVTRVRRIDKVRSTLTMIIVEGAANIELDTFECKQPTAFVLVNNEIGAEADVLKDLKTLKNELGDNPNNGVISGFYAVYGVNDIIVIVKAKTMDKLKEVITWQVRKIDKVRSTTTLIVVIEPQKQK